MNIDRLRDALGIGRPVWVEIWSGEVIWDIYTPGKWLVAGEDGHHRLMLDPVPGDPVVHIKAAGAKGKLPVSQPLLKIGDLPILGSVDEVAKPTAFC